MRWRSGARVLPAFELAERQAASRESARPLNFVIVRGARLITGSTYLPGWTAPDALAKVTRARLARQEIPALARK